MKRQRQTELPRFTVGALALAGASAASGATVQITFANNYVSTVNGKTFFDGDIFRNGEEAVGANYGTGRAVLWGFAPIDDFIAIASSSSSGGYNWIRGVGSTTASSLRGIVGEAIQFTDNRVNGGAATYGWLEVTASTISGVGKVEIHRLIFDDASTAAPSLAAGVTYPEWDSSVSAVPEASTSLGLLALGAGGLLTRRRLKRAA